MNRTEILLILEQILKKECGLNQAINESSFLLKDLHLDSIQLLTLVTSIENNFKIFLNDNPENPPATIGEVIDLIQSSLA